MHKDKLLHIISDKKFIESCEKTFELPSLENHFLDTLKGNEKYIEEHSIDVLIIHYLRDNEVKILSNNNLSIPVIWFFWGADGFSLGKFYNQFLFSKTRMVRLKLSFKKGIINGLRTIVKTIFPIIIDKSAHYRNLIKSFERISIVVPIVPGDYNLLSRKYVLKSTSFHLNYIIPVFDNNTNNHSPNSNNILVGNSASYSNNHIEIIDTLSRMKLGESKIIIPLSYGDKIYGNFIKIYAKKKLKNVLCLTDFMVFKDYHRLVQSCGVVILNHLRQQALGNVLQSLMTGAHIYMQPSSTLYQYLKENLFYISTIGELKQMRLLTKGEQDYNKKMCREVFGEETQHKRVRQLIEKALS